MPRALVVLAILAAPPALAPAAEPAPARPAALVASTPPGSTAECDRRWREYFASERCFARFRTTHRGIKPEAFAVCGPAVPDPSRECTRRTP